LSYLRHTNNIERQCFDTTGWATGAAFDPQKLTFQESVGWWLVKWVCCSPKFPWANPYFNIKKKGMNGFRPSNQIHRIRMTGHWESSGQCMFAANWCCSAELAVAMTLCDKSTNVRNDYSVS